MADEHGFRRYLAAGMEWFSVTQQKAEAIVRDLADSGETAVGQAQKAFERLVERSRQGSEELRELVRSEIREQISALGLATKDDIARLEAKLDAAQRWPRTGRRGGRPGRRSPSRAARRSGRAERRAARRARPADPREPA